MLLQQGLVVLLVPVLAHLVDLGHEQALHELARRQEPRVEVVGADDGLERVGEDGLLAAAPGVLLAAADEDVVVDAQPPGDLRQAGLAHDEALDPRQLALGLADQLFVEVLGHHEAEHGVAEELEALVVRDGGAGLVRPGPVRERLVQALQLAELDARRAAGRAGAPAGAPRPRSCRPRVVPFRTSPLYFFCSSWLLMYSSASFTVSNSFAFSSGMLMPSSSSMA